MRRYSYLIVLTLLTCYLYSQDITDYLFEVEDIYNLLNDINYPNNIKIYSTKKSSSHFLLDINDEKEYCKL